MEKLGSRSLSSGTLASNATRTLGAILIIAILSFLPALYSPTLADSGVFPYQSKDSSLRILFSTNSVTGVVVVGELLPPKAEGADSTTLHSIRYLRASHSLLGGVWIGPSAVSLDNAPSRTDLAGTPLGDSVYSTFVLQEAVRLASSALRSDSTEQENALIM